MNSEFQILELEGIHAFAQKSGVAAHRAMSAWLGSEIQGVVQHSMIWVWVGLHAWSQTAAARCGRRYAFMFAEIVESGSWLRRKALGDCICIYGIRVTSLPACPPFSSWKMDLAASRPRETRGRQAGSYIFCCLNSLNYEFLRTHCSMQACNFAQRPGQRALQPEPATGFSCGCPSAC